MITLFTILWLIGSISLTAAAGCSLAALLIAGAILAICLRPAYRDRKRYVEAAS